MKKKPTKKPPLTAEMCERERLVWVVVVVVWVVVVVVTPLFYASSGATCFFSPFLFLFATTDRGTSHQLGG